MIDEALDQRASLLAHLLVQTRHVDSLLNDVWQAWETICRDGLARPGTALLPQTIENRHRLRFEVSCFGAFLLMEEIVPEAFNHESRSETEAHRFNRTFGNALGAALRELGILGLHEIVVTSYDPKLEFGLGKALDVWRRIANYRSCKTREDARMLYGRNIIEAIDPRNGLAAPLLASSAVNVLQLCHAAFQTALNHRPPPT
jgi:hypothetical protein